MQLVEMLQRQQKLVEQQLKELGVPVMPEMDVRIHMKYVFVLNEKLLNWCKIESYKMDKS